MKKIIKKAITAVVCAMLLVGTMGMTVLAANGQIWGSLNGSWGSATVKNTGGTTRYCYVAIRQYDTDPNQYTIVSSNAGVLSNGNTITTGGWITKNSAIGFGMVYNSSPQQSGVSWTETTRIK
ncbi:MAG: hypothetical protein NC429_17480 [Lachnospiraceae bacterium]|nr:hypothetical protein [Lachnospiraceae bacterium]